MSYLKQYEDHKRLQREERRLEKQENRMRRGENMGLFEGPLAKVQGKIPPQLEETLTAAFGKALGFLLNNKYSPVDRTIHREKLAKAYEQNRETLEEDFSRESLRNFERQSRRGAALNQGVALTEGMALGLLGVGLPDILIFLTLLLRSIYEVGESFGHPADSWGEREFVLLILCSAFARGEQQSQYLNCCGTFGRRLDRGEELAVQPELVEETAGILAKELLLLKFVQGMPLVGVVGGMANGPMMGKIGKMARIQYQKRLLGELRENLGPFMGKLG